MIVAAGAQQSYFGNDHFEAFAPGMKTVDDALELRGRILGAFEAAEVTTSPGRTRAPTDLRRGGRRTDRRRSRRADRRACRPDSGRGVPNDRPERGRVILIEAAPAVLPPMGPKLGTQAQRRLEKMGVEVRLNTMVTERRLHGPDGQEKDGTEHRIDCAVKVWSAGVQASPLGTDPRRTVRRDRM